VPPRWTPDAEAAASAGEAELALRQVLRADAGQLLGHEDGEDTKGVGHGARAARQPLFQIWRMTPPPGTPSLAAAKLRWLLAARSDVRLGVGGGGKKREKSLVGCASHDGGDA
jgi:hypothetical protein